MSFLDRRPYLTNINEADIRRVMGTVNITATDRVNTARPNVVLFKDQGKDIAWLDTVRCCGYIHV